MSRQQTRPLFELRCSNNVVHVHTCADSCAALANLIQYVVNNGDLHPPPRHDSPTEIAGQKVQVSVNVWRRAEGCEFPFSLRKEILFRAGRKLGGDPFNRPPSPLSHPSLAVGKPSVAAFLPSCGDGCN